MTCKDCVHFDICIAHIDNSEANRCLSFKDKSRFIELPCKVGDKVYFVYRGKMFQHKIKELVIQEWEILHILQIVFHFQLLKIMYF